MKNIYYIKSIFICCLVIISLFGSGCASIFEGTMTKQAYDHSVEKKLGLSQWEYEFFRNTPNNNSY